MTAITVRDAKARVHGPDEIAFLDVREHGVFGEGHPFLAVPCPYSRLEERAPALVPRRSAPVVLVDDGDGLAPRAARRLAALGYARVDWIEGGAPAWAFAGFTLFKGVNLPSKTLGELVEHAWHVPSITVEALDALQRDGRAPRLLDGRPASEYATMTIPGARSVPNGELAHRLEALDAADGPVVIHCAGRTRSLIGAAGAILQGVSGPVLALENGTQGWALSGRDLHRGAAPDPLPPADGAASRARARAFTVRHGIHLIDLPEAQRLLAEPDRTTYLLDVRDPAERALRPAPGAVAAPGVQLVQATDAWIGVRHARAILADDTGSRAALAAFWLRQLGVEVFVLTDIDTWPTGWRGASPNSPAPAVPHPITAGEAVARARAGHRLLDLRPSSAYRAGHLAPALWSIRPRLPTDVAGRTFDLVGEAGVVASAAIDLAEGGAAEIRHVAGGPDDWRAEGLPLTTTPDDPADADAIDYLFFVHDRHEGNLEAARRYLAWETGLLAQLDPDERASYQLDAIDLRAAVPGGPS